MANKKLTLSEWMELPMKPVKKHKRVREERKTLAEWNREAVEFARPFGGDAGDTPMWPRMRPRKRKPVAK